MIAASAIISLIGHKKRFVTTKFLVLLKIMGELSFVVRNQKNGAP
jgi:hypothetical protein